MHAPAEPRPLFVPQLLAADGLVHGFSTREGGVSRCYRPGLSAGDLNLGFTQHDRVEDVRTNRLRFLRAIGAGELRQFGLLSQQHTPIVRVVRGPEDTTGDFTAPAVHRGDGLVTNLPGVLLSVQVADCIPVLIFDPKQRAVGAFHAGWRGTLARIVEHGVSAMREAYGSAPEDLVAAIGPGIGPASYTVREEIREQFRSQFAYGAALFSEADGDLKLDLWEANRRQLVDAGLASDNITVTGEDTATATDRYFSHRSEQGFTGRMMGAIGLTR